MGNWQVLWVLSIHLLPRLYFPPLSRQAWAWVPPALWALWRQCAHQGSGSLYSEGAAKLVTKCLFYRHPGAGTVWCREKPRVEFYQEDMFLLTDSWCHMNSVSLSWSLPCHCWTVTNPLELNGLKASDQPPSQAHSSYPSATTYLPARAAGRGAWATVDSGTLDWLLGCSPAPRHCSPGPERSNWLDQGGSETSIPMKLPCQEGTHSKPHMGWSCCAIICIHLNVKRWKHLLCWDWILWDQRIIQ